MIRILLFFSVFLNFFLSQAQFARLLSSQPYSICTKDTVKYTFTFDTVFQKTPDIIQWSFGDGKTLTGFEVSHTYIPGNYSLKLYVKTISTGFSDSIEKNVIIGFAPTPIMSVKSVCNNKSLEDATASKYNFKGTWIWKGDGTYISKTTEPKSQMPFQRGKHKIEIVREYENGCISSTSDSVEFLESVKADFNVNQHCMGETAVFDNKNVFTGAAASQASISWDFGDGVTAVIANPVHVFPTNVSSTKNYIVKMVATLPWGCNDSSMKSVNVNMLPGVNWLSYEYHLDRAEMVFYPRIMDIQGNVSTLGSACNHRWTLIHSATGKVVYKSPMLFHELVLPDSIYIKGDSLVVESVFENTDCSNIYGQNVSIKRVQINNPSYLFPKPLVYPNPCEGILYIQNATQGNNIQIFDMSGRLITTAAIQSEDFKIDMTGLSKGIYYLHLNGKEIQSFKIIHDC